MPTAKELGYDAILDLFRGLSVPKGTSASVKATLADAMSKAAKSDSFMKLSSQKGFTVDPLPVAAFESLLAKEDAKVKGIMKGAGLYQSKRK